MEGADFRCTCHHPRQRKREGPFREGSRSDCIRKPAPSRGSVAAVIVGVLVVAAVVYIMVNGIGLNPDLDFGAGAYYYADIPDYQKTLNWDVYAAQLPFWVYLLLFLAWGFLMWRLWKRIK